MEQTQEEEALMEDILKKEENIAQLDRKIKDNKKEINHIKQSNTWKLSTVFRTIKRIFVRLFNQEERVKEQQYIEQLETKLLETERELFETREQVHDLKLRDKELTRNEVYQYIRDMKNEGELLSYIDSFIEQKNQLQMNYKEALIYAARLYMNKDKPYRNVLYTKILAGFTIEEIPEFMIRAGLTEQSIPLRKASSFRASLNMRMRQKQLNDTLPEWHLDDKRTAYEFVEQLGVPVPTVDDEHYTFDMVPKREGIVIKPADGAGSRGVYLVHSMEEIIDVKKSIKLNSWDKLKESIEHDLETGAVEKDDWMIEQLVYENKAEKTPARDVKFYCFYGKVGIILEITRYPEVRQCWWTAQGERIATEKYDENLFSGTGVTEEEIEMVQRISEKIPAPFIRIDFLRAENELVFGEFTPKPGNYDEFDQATDEWLGDYFIDAQGRLTTDLLNGKQFEAYKTFVKEAGRMTV